VFRRDDGKLIPVEISAVRFDLERAAVRAVHHSRHPRAKKAEAERERLHKEIEAERNRLRQILEQMPVGVIVAEAPSGRLLFCNRESERLLRHPMLPLTTIGDSRNTRPARGRQFLSAGRVSLARALISGDVIKGEEMKYRRGDGTRLSSRSIPRRINDPEGRKVLAVTTFY